MDVIPGDEMGMDGVETVPDTGKAQEGQSYVDGLGALKVAEMDGQQCPQRQVAVRGKPGLS